MKKQPNKVDEFFRETLQDHKVVPSEAAKAAFLKEAATLEGSRKFYTRWYFYLSAIILVVLTGAGLSLLRSGHSTKKTGPISTTSSVSNSLPGKKGKIFTPTYPSENKINEKENKSSTNPIQKINTSPPQNRNTKSFTTSTYSPDKRTEHPETASSSSPIEKPVSKNPKSTFNDKKPDSQNPPSEPQVKNPVPEPATIVATQPLSGSATTKDSVKKTNRETTDTLTTVKLSTSNPEPEPVATQKNWNFGIGLYYAPEWLFNTLEGEKYVNNFGIEGTFHFGRYSIRTGAGLSMTKGTNELSVNYNDYLGHFNKLDSIQFTWNPTHSKLIPTYYFTNENVWDSLMKVADAKVVKRYTYLQIPLILGYDFWQNEQFSIGLRAGPILSVLLNSEVLSDNYDPGKNKIILINRIAPERIQTNWQILGGINATYHFSRRYGIELEPKIRYYFNSVYEKSAINKKPWSVGIRAAFIIIL